MVGYHLFDTWMRRKLEMFFCGATLQMGFWLLESVPFYVL